MTLRRYQDMKASGALWLGDIPWNWQVKRLKRLCAVLPSNVDKKTYEGQLPVKLCNYTDVYYNEEITADLEFMSATATPEQVVRFSLKSGDTIVTKDSETSNDIAVASYVPNALPGVVCGYHLAIVRPKGPIHGRYVKRLFDSKYLRSRFDVAANGLTRVGLSQYAFDNVEVPLPPRDEQEQIVAFLERETQRIDALVAQQERLVELLKEKRQVVISHAVTKGLNPDAPMKPSGIDWLGDIPSHWSVSKVGRHCSILSGYAFPSAGFSEDEAHVRLLRGVNVGVSRIRWDEVVYWKREPDDDLDSFLLRPGQIVVGMDRPWIREGARVAIVGKEDVPSLLLQRVAALTTRGELDNRFLFLLLGSEAFEREVTPETTGVSVPHISPSQISAFPIPLPPLEEQVEIVTHVASFQTKSHELIEQAQIAIELLAERRNAVISAAVTGQIDVRERTAVEIA